jgi:hypothetical protein
VLHARANAGSTPATPTNRVNSQGAERRS